ncbi:MAG: cytochrome c-type biogenesis protein CcmH [Alphaproteobacteria bacterium]|nr:cytochrome c-type biogenesis protein CcmH [Alphaproteobacteria bacterium]
MNFIKLCVAGVVAILVLANVAFAVLPDEMLKDPNLEARARVISQDLRCLVCQNQSIDDSNAPLAKDLRIIVRERLTAGDTNEQVFAYVVARYGNYVLLKPPLQTDTLVLWLMPFALLIVALGTVAFYLRKRPQFESEDGIEPDAEIPRR